MKRQRARRRQGRGRRGDQAARLPPGRRDGHDLAEQCLSWPKRCPRVPFQPSPADASRSGPFRESTAFASDRRSSRRCRRTPGHVGGAPAPGLLLPWNTPHTHTHTPTAPSVLEKRFSCGGPGGGTCADGASVARREPSGLAFGKNQSLEIGVFPQRGN
jgi:hypothetical protein